MSSNNSARWVNVVAGGWLFLSAFIWTHSSSQFNNAWLVGANSVIVALIALRTPPARYINAALGAWLFVSIWVLPLMTRGTFWNDLVVSIVMFVAALTPSHGERVPHGSIAMGHH
jgi:hypothetical protein